MTDNQVASRSAIGTGRCFGKVPLPLTSLREAKKLPLKLFKNHPINRAIVSSWQKISELGIRNYARKNPGGG